ncbi:hypothetical protein EVAR_76090_1 [Eumeta japonica]|uniref:Uncharacterized protein n=1 Tax=Eumeta variegata TaxID=151549 RepID=A0A4C1W6M7_EUMVA|nr:hypothetical protein EVAR_76090_1 [Eumeta japonica]
MTAGPRKDPPKNFSSDTSTEDIKMLLSEISNIDVGELAFLAKKFMATANSVEKIIDLAEHASLVEWVKIPHNLVYRSRGRVSFDSEDLRFLGIKLKKIRRSCTPTAIYEARAVIKNPDNRNVIHHFAHTPQEICYPRRL